MLNELNKCKSSDGTLLAINNIDTNIRRMFYITGVPKNCIRGNHAHIKNHQHLVCIKGKIEIGTFDGYKENHYHLTEGEYIVIPNMIWSWQTYLTGDDILLGLCSHEYDETDYIRNYNEFTRIKNEHSSNSK